MRYLLLIVLLIGCGREGDDGQDAKPCTATETEQGVVVSCPDQDPVVVQHGQRGDTGAPGRTGVGVPGPRGPQGQPAQPCHVQQMGPHKAVVMCPDGSSAVLVAPGKGKDDD